MKSKISLSRFANILTAIIFILLFVGCIATVHEKIAFFVFLTIYIVLIVAGLFYGTAYIKADSENLILGSILRSKKIPMRNIQSVELFQPTMGAIRICGSGGFMGYWGIFKEGDIGRYYSFYGKASDCFLVRMKNGDKYVLGCDNPSKMVDHINSQIGK